MSNNDSSNDMSEARRIIGALLRQPPKLHDEMKVGKRSERKKPKTDSEDGSPKGNAKASKESR